MSSTLRRTPKMSAIFAEAEPAPVICQGKKKPMAMGYWRATNSSAVAEETAGLASSNGLAAARRGGGRQKALIYLARRIGVIRKAGTRSPRPTTTSSRCDPRPRPPRSRLEAAAGAGRDRFGSSVLPVPVSGVTGAALPRSRAGALLRPLRGFSLVTSLAPRVLPFRPCAFPAGFADRSAGRSPADLAGRSPVNSLRSPPRPRDERPRRRPRPP
jgi:hypothetical protein